MKLGLTLISFGTLVCCQTLAASSDGIHPLENHWEICTHAVIAAEKTEAIPIHLLNAISQAESGRWNSQKQENIAWPWTITAQGKGQFFGTKHEAVAETEILLTQGVRNIDVGCMQINLMFHPDAFETLESAFDPATNVQYGANYLKAKYNHTNDWYEAAAHYHSTTPTLARNYKAKIKRLWSKINGTLIPEISNPNGTKDHTPKEPEIKKNRIDSDFTDRLNTAFWKRRRSKTPYAKTKDILYQAKSRLKEKNIWRQNQSKGLSLVNLAMMRRAELADRRAKHLNRTTALERAKSFAKRRHQELAKWRARRKNTQDIGFLTK